MCTRESPFMCRRVGETHTEQPRYGVSSKRFPNSRHTVMTSKSLYNDKFTNFNIKQ